MYILACTTAIINWAIKSRADYYKIYSIPNLPTQKHVANAECPAALTTKNPEATKSMKTFTIFYRRKNLPKPKKKRKADAQFGVTYWTPQLLYIEALYNVKEKNDSV